MGVMEKQQWLDQIEATPMPEECRHACRVMVDKFNTLLGEVLGQLELATRRGRHYGMETGKDTGADSAPWESRKYLTQ